VAPPYRFARTHLIDRRWLYVSGSDVPLRSHEELHAMRLEISTHAHKLASLCVKLNDSLRSKILESI